MTEPSASPTVPAGSALKARITDDMKAAMRAREAERLGAIRMLLAAIKQREVDERIVLDDAQVAAIVDKLIKQRRDSISQFEQAGRTDLVDKERAEVEVLSAYLPRQATEAEVAAELEAAIVATGATGPQDMGKVMGVLKVALAGRTDLSKVSGIVKARLSQR
ncbi:MAG: GatB/YqeY domain-containing protein [Burkholderiaceae bacterium]